MEEQEHKLSEYYQFDDNKGKFRCIKCPNIFYQEPNALHLEKQHPDDHLQWQRSVATKKVSFKMCAVFSLFSKFQLKQQRKRMRGSTAADADVVYPDPNNLYKCISYGQIFLYDKSVSKNNYRNGNPFEIVSFNWAVK